MLKIQIDDAAFLQGCELGYLETDIFSDARSMHNPVSGRGGGYPYFWPVDLGRGPVVAKTAKALAIPTANGVIFRKRVGPAAPRNIRQQSFTQFETSAINAAINAGTGELKSSLRAWFVVFLNKLAYFHSQVLSEVTPRRSGKLASSYRPTSIG